MRPLALLLLLILGVGCTKTAPPRAQLVFYVDTDAPIAPALRATDPIPLFDRIRFDVIAPGESTPCADCVREFAVDDARFRAGNVSIGIVPPPGTPGVRVRVRLFARTFAGDAPDPISTIDALVALPPVPDGTVLESSVLLSTDRVGIVADAPVDATPGRPAVSRVGTWGPARRTWCNVDPAPGEVCVPGGAFWAGNTAESSSFGEVPDWHRLIVLSPFFVDATEVTVAQMRASKTAVAIPWTQSDSGTDGNDWCTFTAGPQKRGMGSSDDLPVNCVAWAQAQAYCSKKGAALPTDMQQTYLLGGLRALPYVWGSEAPLCSEAVWGKNGFGLTAYFEPSKCRNPATDFLLQMGGPQPPGSGLPLWVTHGDAIELPTGTIVDIAGNLSEWTLDGYESRAETCWTPTGILVDPRCPSGGGRRSTHGGSWSEPIFLMSPPARNVFRLNDVSNAIGFRCARPGM